MQIRPLTPADLDALRDIDGTTSSSAYFHVDVAPADAAPAFRLERRQLRENRTHPNALTEDTLFTARQLATGIEDGLALVTEINDQPVALMLALPNPQYNTLDLIDLRVDFDVRRQGIGLAMGFMLLQYARDKELRAVRAESPTDNLPAAEFLTRCGFQIAGLDTHRHSNHDLVKERATLIWYAKTE